MDEQLKITAMSPDMLLKLLRQSGSRYASVETIQKAIDAGAPTNDNGTINLIALGAWLAAQRGDDANG